MYDVGSFSVWLELDWLTMLDLLKNSVYHNPVLWPPLVNQIFIRNSLNSRFIFSSGCIWARYSLVIIPKNWNLFAVNLFLGFTGIWQLARILK
jgi:hypothetical protein